MDDFKELGYRFREPAAATTAFMEVTRKENENLKINIMGMQKDIKNLCEKLDDHNKRNDKSFEDLNKKFDDFKESTNTRYADAEQFRFWRNVLIMGIVVSTLVGIIGIWVDRILHP